MGSRRRFTREFKHSVVQQLDSRPLAEICRENDILPIMVQRWRREYESNPEEAFQGNGRLWKEEAKAARYERLIGQIYSEIDLLKKSIANLRQLRAEEQRERQCIK